VKECDKAIRGTRMSNQFEPKIISFLCNWCSYAGADLAGTSRMQYPQNVRIIRVPCSGRVDPLFVLRAFLDGADGVMVLGCHPGDCHYKQGNYVAQRRYAIMHRLLEFTGVEKDRLIVDWVSASEGKRFAEVVTNFTEQVRNLGPMVMNGNKEKLSEKLQEIAS
jgi:F420-non-reducing hydrogenase iron-sulfur subunit